MNTILIHKTATTQFWHTHNNDVATNFEISDFYVNIDGNNFNIVELNGAVRYTYLVQNITIKNLNNAVESGFTPITLRTRLEEISYTPYLNVTGLTLSQLQAIQNANNPSLNNPFATINDITPAGTTTPLYGTFTLVRKAQNNTANTIELDDLAHGQIDAETYCLLGRFKNYENDNDTNNPLNYEVLSSSGLVSQ